MCVCVYCIYLFIYLLIYLYLYIYLHQYTGLDDEACRQEGREDADLSHLSAEATLPLLDSTRTLLHESQHSPCLGMCVCVYLYICTCMYIYIYIYIYYSCRHT